MSTYAGQKITVIWHAERCIHSRNCVLGRPDVFLANAPGDWIHPDSAPPEALAALIEACPSGALAYECPDGGRREAPPLVNVLRVRENGPLEVKAELVVGNDASSYRATLCRCGQSKNKPYCDGTHIAAGFVASGEPPGQESAPLGTRNGQLKVAAAPNGPLLLTGPLEICSGTGRTLTRVTQAALCRCGQSGSKPYCDGSHARVGFAAEPLP